CMTAIAFTTKSSVIEPFRTTSSWVLRRRSGAFARLSKEHESEEDGRCRRADSRLCMAFELFIQIRRRAGKSRRTADRESRPGHGLRTEAHGVERGRALGSEAVRRCVRPV